MGGKKDIGKIERVSRQITDTRGPTEQAVIGSRHALCTNANFALSSPNLGKRPERRVAEVLPVKEVSSPHPPFRLGTGVAWEGSPFFLWNKG